MEERKKKQEKELSRTKVEGSDQGGPGNRAMFNFMGRYEGLARCQHARGCE
jgi:hypothetical protein